MRPKAEYLGLARGNLYGKDFVISAAGIELFRYIRDIRCFVYVGTKLKTLGFSSDKRFVLVEMQIQDEIEMQDDQYSDSCAEGDKFFLSTKGWFNFFKIPNTSSRRSQ